mmetsp:Transcript_36428/g.47798  ORF Transcript_36428/g.47798 Transcript_36428/m.47798 type:complete len:92 (+) Transcript_36428:1767-2042(+)|eukprot:CAMPEP_0185588358 /NCGR_PEP_ID=MMETSP0434-20130131/52716_1 /TAXON_ID=626734 ORGANISM="Favella taraikaensis, Strain Fe Narragansett Bay" /NCGR_SAMPLE_ID=MMETSP0434 /ASSEMBLY_ACC=CAM_ASM_000379 /LENGTH=91 /DNA_ID=CAMNT_0028210947 /DNA_START=2489 /DNA_END=2764 /DNA_ORIENTATION=-
MKAIAKPLEHKDSSVFIASKAQIEAAKKRELMMRNASTTQSLDPQAQAAANANRKLKAILHKENKIKDPLRVKKAVTFMLALDEESEDEPA